MSEELKTAVEQATRDLRDRRRHPKVRELNAAIEAFIRRAPAFDGEKALAAPIGKALSEIEAILDPEARALLDDGTVRGMLNVAFAYSNPEFDVAIGPLKLMVYKLARECCDLLDSTEDAWSEVARLEKALKEEKTT